MCVVRSSGTKFNLIFSGKTLRYKVFTQRLAIMVRLAKKKHIICMCMFSDKLALLCSCNGPDTFSDKEAYICVNRILKKREINAVKCNGTYV